MIEFTITDYISIVTMLKEQLEKYRLTTDEPDELEWEIRVYEYILKDDITSRYRSFMDARFDKDGIPLDKREVVKKLGWDIK